MIGWKEILAEPLVSVSFDSREGAAWGRILGVSSEWGVMRMVQNTGEIGPILLFKLEDVQDVALEWRAKDSLVEVMDEIDDGPRDPDSLLKELTQERAIISFGLDSSEPYRFARLESIEGDWIVWREYTSQGIERVLSMVPLERIRYVETDGLNERALAARLAASTR